MREMRTIRQRELTSIFKYVSGKMSAHSHNDTHNKHRRIRRIGLRRDAIMSVVGK